MKTDFDEVDIKQLEDEFNAVVEDLKQDTGLSKFKREYEFLFQALQASNERVNSHIVQFQKLKEGMLIDTYGVETALHQTENDETLKKKLVAQIDQIKKMIESLKERDEKNQGRIELHKSNIAQINQTIKNWQILNNGDEEIIDRQNAVERLKSEIEFIRGKIDALQNQQTESRIRLSETIASRQAAQTTVTDQKVKLGNWQKKLEEQDKTRTSEIKDIENLKKEREQLNSDKTHVQEKQKQLKEVIEKLQAAKLETMKKIKHSEKENARLYKSEVEMAKRFDDLIELNRLIQKDLSDYEAETLKLEKEVRRYEEQIEKVDGNITTNETKLKALQGKIETEKYKQVSLRNQTEDLERICEEIRGQIEDDTKRSEELVRETNLLRDFLNKVDTSNQDKTEEIKRAEKENELCYSRFNTLKKQQSVVMTELKSMKDENVKLLKDISIMRTRQGSLEEEIRMKGEMVSKYNTNLAHLTVKLKQQQALYENVKRDKLLYSKQLAETQNEIVELRRKYKTLIQNISTLKEEIERKEEDLTKEYFKTKDLEKNCEAQVKTNELLATYLKKKDAFFEELFEKISDLKRTIDIFKTQKEKINEQLEIVISERDLLSTEVIKRHKELRTLNEKLTIIDHLFRKSEKQFGVKATLSVSLKKTARELLVEIKGIKLEVEKIPELFIDYQLLEKEYLNEKLKCNFLIQELQCPINVHKWRKLESTDNKAFEMLSKIYVLTKSLLGKNEVAAMKRRETEDLEKGIDKVKVALDRKPTVMEVEMCEKMKLSIVERASQLEELEGKVAESKNKFFESEFHVKQLDEELKSVRLQLSETVRFQIAEKGSLAPKMDVTVKLGGKRVLGGGFVISGKAREN
jgi:chromosome segregation ATPase